jgi:cell filamentation protein
MQNRPGEPFGPLAYEHPFLDDNGRTLLTVHTDLARRAGFHIDWPAIGKSAFLTPLTEELHKPDVAMDALLAPPILPGPLPMQEAGSALRANPGLQSPGPKPGS